MLNERITKVIHSDCRTHVCEGGYGGECDCGAQALVDEVAQLEAKNEALKKYILKADGRMGLREALENAE